MAYDDSFFLLVFFALIAVLGWAVGYFGAMLFDKIFRR